MTVGKYHKKNRLIILAGLVSLLCFPVPGAAKVITVVDAASKTVVATLPVLQAGQYEFIPLSRFAKALSIPYTTDPRKKQATLEIPHNPVTVYGINPFLRVGDRWEQMPIAVLIIDDEYYVPVQFFLKKIQDVLAVRMKYNPLKSEIELAPLGSTIASVRIDDKQNGTLIRIGLSQAVNASNIYTSESNGWLYVDLYGGDCSTFRTSSIQKTGTFVDRTTSMQLSRDTARLGFQLNKKVKEKNVAVTNNPPEIIISLRSHEEVPTALLEKLEREREKWKIDLIVIDPGHGGKDPGALSAAGLKEKDVVLKIAREIKAKLEKELKVKVIMTRNSDVFIPLEKRSDIANHSGGKLFISIHADSNPNKKLRGHTVYFMGPAKTEAARRVAQYENSVIRFEEARDKYAGLSETAFILAANAQNSYNKESEEFAAILDREMKKRQPPEGFGVRQAGFYVLYGASMPNILLETAFISNTSDEKQLNSKDFQTSVADAVCKSVQEFKTRYENAL